MIDNTLQNGLSRRVKQVRKRTLPLRHLLLGSGVGLLLAIFCSPYALAANSTDPTVSQPWLAEWVAQGTFEEGWLNTLLAPLTPDPRVVRLMDNQAEAKPYYLYRKNFINQRRIQRGHQLMRTHRTLLQQIQEQYHVPAEVVVALWGVESDFGRSAGGFSILRSLYTLATEYPRRANFFRDELRHFLQLCQEEGWDPRQIKGSFAGAIGQMQMMPSTLRQYAVDFSGDGKRDIFNNPADVLASIASFLAGHHWDPDGILAVQLKKKKNMDLSSLVSPSLNEMQPWQTWQERGVSLSPQDKKPDPNEPAALIRLEEQQGSRYYVVFGNFKVITQWNRSSRFAMVVRELAEAFRKGE